MKLDPYKSKEKYLNWKEKTKEGIQDITKSNSDIIKQYLNDMENGINISTKNVKGSRSYGRLSNLKERMIFFAKKFEELYKINNLIETTEEQLFSFFSDMRNGKIKKVNGSNYMSIDTYAKVFKAFWHWHQKINRKKNIDIKDITLDLDTKQEKPKWVYLTEEQVRKLCNKAKYEYKVLIMFLFDTGIRSPTELMNIKVSDFYNEFKELNIRDEISKTFGRKIKLMLCSDLIKEYVKEKGIKDYLFTLHPSVANRYLKRLALSVLGSGESLAGSRYDELTMYDFRHVSCCYWLPRYKSESALKYRFGWKKSDKIHYYSELLGMKDTINEDDLFIDNSKTEIEKRLERSEREKEILSEKVIHMENQMSKILELVNELGKKIN